MEVVGAGTKFATGWEVARVGRATRWVIGVVAALVALGALALVGARVWLGSERGRRTVERKVDDAVARRLGGHAHIGHISGSLVGGVTLDDVVWRDSAG